MKVFVVVEIFQGVVSDIKVFLTRQSAARVEQEWLKEQGITDDLGRELKAEDGIEFILRECELIS